MTVNIYQKRRNTYERVYEDTYSLPSLIDPSDISDEAAEWSDISDEEIEQTVSESLTVANNERQYEGEIRNLAVSLWRESLPRVAMEDMVFDTKEEAVKNGYYPNKMTYVECEEILFEQDIPTDIRQEAREVIDAAIADKLDPRTDKFDSL